MSKELPISSMLCGTEASSAIFTSFICVDSSGSDFIIATARFVKYGCRDGGEAGLKFDQFRPSIRIAFLDMGGSSPRQTPVNSSRVVSS